MEKSCWLHLRWTPAERAALQERARLEKRTMAEVARDAIAAGLACAGGDRPGELPPCGDYARGQVASSGQGARHG